MDNTEFKKVFFVASHGMAGDHLFDWFPKALGAHPEIYIYLGESVRSKYFNERSRKERPDIVQYSNFLKDLGGSTYQSIGECFSYRAYQLEQLTGVFGDDVRWVNLVRHPYAWLDFYVSWRASNLNMPLDNTMAIDHEWSVTKHDYFSSLNLIPYSKDNVSIWASYQGMDILNRMLSDRRPNVTNIPIESICNSQEQFQSVVTYLTHGRINYNSHLLDLVFSWLQKPFRQNSKLIGDPEYLRSSWPTWKHEAFSKIIKAETISMFESYGYQL
ncbi:MAG: hypothetical protein OEZ58_20390 [Gammaproteobacteria bacterium]|nr:hypothetical protein [Gammaproteobacteria bacterium]